MKVVVLDILSGKRGAIVNARDAERLGITLHDRLMLRRDGRSVTCIAEITKSLIAEGKVGLYGEVAAELQVKEGDDVEVSLAKAPASVEFIRKKLAGKPLTGEEIKAIVGDVVSMNLSDLEIASFLMAQEFHGMSLNEVEALTKAMVETGLTLEFPGVVVDKHSIGGIPGNKVSLLIVPIVAAAGLLIPKTSSRAITSPSGTADTMSVLCDVKLSVEEFRSVVMKVGGSIIWGGSLNLAPADDLFVRIEQPLRIDPRSQMVASILSKKAAAGVNHLVLDIPVGRGAKVATAEEARGLAADFIEIGKRIGINIRCGVTYGGQPIGRAVGPALEAREALMALESPDAASKSLVEKSTSLAGLLLELGGLAGRGKGAEAAKEILRKGTAHKKFLEIVEAQGGDPNIKPEDIKVGAHVHRLYSDSDGYVTMVDNEAISSIARAAGAPLEKGAGVYLHVKQGHKVERGDLLMEIYAERSTKLAEAVAVANSRHPFIIEGMLLSTIPV